MNDLKIGFSRVNITPPLGIDVSGYYVPRIADGILDELEINCIALEQNGKRALMLSFDLLQMKDDCTNTVKNAVMAATGVDEQAIYLHSTHTHTGPAIVAIGDNAEKIQKYLDFLTQRAADVSVMALADLTPCKMGYGTGTAPNIAFVRRFRMKDGSIRTNPGVNNPDIVAPMGDVDESVNVLRFDREDGQTIISVNFGDHPDVVGGTKISGDWPALTRKVVEKTLDNTKCIVFNGCEGDVNHVNVFPTGGYLNGMFMDFDDVSRGYDHSLYMARVITGGVLQAFDKVKYCDNTELNYHQKKITLASNMADPKDLPEAHRINDLHLAGKDDEIGAEGMMLTTIVAEAARMVRLENGPESFEMTLSGISLGPVAFIGFPGEPFTGIGRGVKEYDGFELVMHTCLTNGCSGYFPMTDAYTEGGYEAKSSIFKAGVAESLITEGINVLKELNK